MVFPNVFKPGHLLHLASAFSVEISVESGRDVCKERQAQVKASVLKRSPNCEEKGAAVHRVCLQVWRDGIWLIMAGLDIRRRQTK